MVSKAEIAEFRERLTKLTQSAEVLFDEAESRHFGGKTFSDAWEDLLDDSQRGRAEELREETKQLSVLIAGAARGSPMIADADFKDIRHDTRRMLGALRFQHYR